jgi:ubiquinol-cytochrome c reductase cytochrome c1 subunit
MMRLGVARVANGLRRMSTAAAAEPAAAGANWKRAAGALGIAVGGSTIGLAYGDAMPLMAEDEFVHPPHFPWNHSGSLQTFDTASIRRGYEVYKQVCAACHSMDRIAFRNLVGTVYPEEHVKALAAAETVVNKEVGDDGLPFERAGKLSDYMPAPYANEQASRAANGGAYPPDLSVIVKARHGNEDYIFSLLTGYCDPPAGVTIAEGQNFNPYFPGSKLAMAAPLYDEVIEYEDGTPATKSQLAKDVATFLCWTAEPEHDDRKRMGMKAIISLSVLTGLLYYYKRVKWSPLKSRQLVYSKGGKF